MGGVYGKPPSAPFDNFVDWSPSKVASILAEWTQQESYGLDLDATETASLLKVSRFDGETLVEKLSRKGTDFGDDRINALALLSGVVMLNSNLSAAATAAGLFDIFDLDRGGKLSFDEATIMLVTTERAVKVMMGIGVAWGSYPMEPVTEAAFSHSGLKTSPLIKYRVGDHVECRYHQKARWYRAKVKVTHPDQETYDVRYDDGNEEEQNVHHLDMRFVDGFVHARAPEDGIMSKKDFVAWAENFASDGPPGAMGCLKRLADITAITTAQAEVVAGNDNDAAARGEGDA
jgi:hypothetical protein